MTFKIEKMKKIIFTLAVMGFVFALTSCNNPLNKKYSEDNLEKDAREIFESKKVDSTDMAYMGMYIVRAKMSGEQLDGKTYNDILKKAKELRKKNEKEDAEAKALAEKTAKAEEEKRQTFAKILTVALYDKGFYKGDFEKGEFGDYLTYKVAYENKSDKDIRAVKGSLLITDLFDTEIKTINLVEDKGIPAGKTVMKVYTTDYNQFEDEDTRLRSKRMEDIKVVWTPEKIIFADGSTLE